MMLQMNLPESPPAYSQKHTGAFFTPADIARSLTAWAARCASDRLLDPSCGDGQFLAMHRNSVGIERNPLSARDAIARAPGALVHEGDFFAWASETRERFECAVGNPPFIRYQVFKGDMRRCAVELCSRLGVQFNGLSSSWAPFLVAAAGLLKRGGRMAFIVPAEIGHAPYAVPLLEYLVASFARVHVVAVREKLFPTLSEDCWLLFAEGHGGRAEAIDFTAIDRFVPGAQPPPASIRVFLDEWRHVWNRRLRPFVLPSGVRAVYAHVSADSASRRLGDFASVGIGYVSGSNSFFHLRPSDAERWNIPAQFLHPSLRNSRAMPKGAITKATVDTWHKRDDEILLLRLKRGQELPVSVRRYLDSSEGKVARRSYKCRNRTPWYAVPDVQVPDFVIGYMSGRAVGLARNLAGVTCTNSVHSVRITNLTLASKFLPRWSEPFVRLSCELEGHALGGGLLKIEPREATRILLPNVARLHDLDADALEASVQTLQRWRHYVN